MVFTWEMIDLLGLLDFLEGWWFHVLPPGGTKDVINIQKFTTVNS